MFIQAKLRGSFSVAIRVVLLCAAGAALTACGIADAVSVGKGNNPEFADDMVRFRTTYYFRTLDVCAVPDNSQVDNTFSNRLTGKQVFIRKARIKEVLSDSLYRFRMTGKASPWSKVHFESGTLKSWQIDPFSSVAAYDKQNNRFYWKSQASTQSDAQEAEVLNTVERLSDLSKKLKKDSPIVASGIDTMIAQKLASLTPEGANKVSLSRQLAYAQSIRKISTDALAKGQKAATPTIEPQPSSFVETQNLDTSTPDTNKGTEEASTVTKENALETIDGYIGGMLENITTLSGFITTVGKDKEKLNIVKQALASAKTAYSMMITLRQQLANGEDTPVAGVSQTGKCSPGAKFRRGFQLIGPEGVKIFDQDDRLLMAMSSSAAPVIGAIQELSGRMLQQKVGISGRLLPLVRERVRLMEAENLAKDMEKLSATDQSTKLQAIIDSLKENGGKS